MLLFIRKEKNFTGCNKNIVECKFYYEGKYKQDSICCNKNIVECKYQGERKDEILQNVVIKI